MQSGLSPFLVNIIPLQNIQTNTSGLDATTQLTNTVDGLVQMVNFEQKRIYADALSSYTPDASIQVLSPMNLNGVNITGGGSVLVNGDGTNSVGTFNSLIVDASGTFGGLVYAAGFITVSDERRKSAIQQFDIDRLRDIEELHAYTYTINGNADIGFLAQEVQTRFPELVHQNPHGDLFVNYQGMIPVLLEAVQDLRGRVSTLEAALQRPK